MPRLPVLSGAELIRLLQKVGFGIQSQEGSHVKLAKGSVRTVVPLHRELRKGTLLAILRQTGISREELEELIKGNA